MEFKEVNGISFYHDRYNNKYYEIVKATQIANKLIDIKVRECELNFITTKMIPIDGFINREYYYEELYELISNPKARPTKLKGCEVLQLSELQDRYVLKKLVSK